jgi:N-terminal domain of (some) glycogen debranching enzymes
MASSSTTPDFCLAGVLTINGVRPTVLSVDETAYYQAQHFLALGTGVTYIDSHVTVIRRRSVGGGFREALSVTNHDARSIDLDIRIEAESDFADLFEIKNKSSEKQGAISRHVDRDRELTLTTDPERQAREIVHAGLDAREIQVFDDENLRPHGSAGVTETLIWRLNS